jgi:hypothetical protein
MEGPAANGEEKPVKATPQMMPAGDQAVQNRVDKPPSKKIAYLLNILELECDCTP